MTMHLNVMQVCIAHGAGRRTWWYALVLAVIALVVPVLAQASLPVPRVTQSVSPEALAQVAQQAVVAAGDLHTRLVARARSPRPLEVDAGSVRLSSSAFVLAAHPTATQIVWVQVLVNDRLVRSVPVVVEIQAFRAVHVARHAIAPQTPLSAALFEVQEREITDLPYAPLALSSELQGLELRDGVHAGDILLSHLVRPAPAVRRGQKHWVELTQGSVSVRREVTVAHDAQTGQIVRLHLVNSPVSMQAMVVGSNRLEIFEK